MFYLLLESGPENLRAQLSSDVHWHLLALYMINHLDLKILGEKKKSHL